MSFANPHSAKSEVTRTKGTRYPGGIVRVAVYREGADMRLEYGETDGEKFVW